MEEVTNWRARLFLRKACLNREKVGFLLILAVLLFFGVAPFAAATTIDSLTWSGTSCGSSGLSGSGSCYGLTYSLVVTDAGDSDSTTFSATLNITGTYTGSASYTYIGAVDIKPGSVTGANLTGAPGGTGGWTTSWLYTQAAQNCLPPGSGGFLCSYDTSANTFAPVTVGGAVNYSWAWDFTMSGAYTFGHMGVNFTVADDSCIVNPGAVVTPDCKTDGQNISISGGGGNGQVPEPSTLLLLGAGLIVVSGVARKLRREH